MNKTIEYLKEVRIEMDHVTWPSRSQAIFYTVAVLVISIAIAYLLRAFDVLFSHALGWFLTK